MLYRLFVVLLLPAVAIVLPSAADAAACSGASGVTVVVDYDNGAVDVGCAPGDPASGYDALVKAGFHPTYAQGNGTGALCSINQVPDRACPSMPPADAYWAYFHAKRGGAWQYSTYGGASYDPKPGTVEGWHFRGSPDDPPRTAPPGAVVTPTATAKPTQRPTARPTASSSHPAAQPASSGHPGGGSGAAAPEASASAPGTAAADPTDRPTGTPSPAATDAVAAPEDQVADAARPLGAEVRGERAGSSDHSWVWGVALVAVLGAAAAAVAVRRRKA